MLVLLTDQADRSIGLSQLLEQIAPCRVVVPGSRPVELGVPALGLVADLDLMQPASVLSLRSYVAALGGSRTPLICLMRTMSERSMAQARSLGAGLCLSDFGTGYSALSYLQRFPFDTIKLDQSFVRQMGTGKTAILRSIVKMATELNLAIVAEGTESEADAQALMELGCEYAEGQAFGEPMTTLQARQLVGAAPEAA